MLKFEWDEKKNRDNRKKHGIWFEEVKAVFADPLGRLFLDEGHEAGEDRFVLVGLDSNSRLLVVVHCYREAEQTIRLISARSATKREVQDYEEEL